MGKLRVVVKAVGGRFRRYLLPPSLIVPFPDCENVHNSLNCKEPIAFILQSANVSGARDAKRRCVLEEEED